MKTKTLKGIIFGLSLGLFTMSLHAQVYSSCDQWASYTTNGYTIYNNIWGSNAGTQCLWVNSYQNWGVTANHTNTSGIKSYPNVAQDCSYAISNLGSCTSSFNVSRPSSGSYNTSYDIWCNNYAYEIMLWMNYTGAVGPIAQSWDASGNPVADYTSQSIGGHTWNVYSGSNGSNQVYSFLRTSNTNSGTVDIKAIMDWLVSHNYFSSSTNLHRIQFGFEITTSSNGSFTCNSYSLSHSSGSSTCTPTSITPYLQVNGGSWQQTANVTVSSGSTVKFGPQPVSGGSWSWSTGATTREITISNITSSASYTATYTNSCGAKSTQTFNVTVSGGGSTTGNISVRARGTVGDEQIQLKAEGTTIGNWTLSTSYQTFSASGSGTVQVYFINDNGSRDVQVDYVTIDGTTYQSENQATNTGVWQNSQCGGSYSEWLHCNGYIQYGSSSSGGSTTTSTITIQENATGFCSVDGTVDNNNTGYTGTGFANTTNSSGQGITWSVSIPSSGSYTLKWRYANGTSTSRPGQLMVDGSTVVSSVAFAGTGSWTTWTETSGTIVNLSAGTHLIRLQATTSNGLANIDYISVTGITATPVSCAGQKSATVISEIADPDVEAQVKIYPVPVTDNIVNIEMQGISGESAIRIIDLNGKIIRDLRVTDQNLVQVGVEDLSGMYFVQIITSKETYNRKITIQ
ncbi:MAG: carbohydrate-binding protein [Bacteroidales bacterium]|nr:carbohydrate-binding protein [Bacteroidales bacterium]